MAHKVLINGTFYQIGGGKTKVGGTSYSIETGKTKISGTNYTIEVAGKCNLNITGRPSYSYVVPGYGGISYYLLVNGSGVQNTGIIQVNKNSTVTVNLSITASGISYGSISTYNGTAISVPYSFTATSGSVTIDVTWSSSNNTIYLTITQ